jgi:glutathione synthase/RimK-type ligase-like ATP-grasp enzyme
MKIGIHQSKGTFSDRWITYCNENNIEWKVVNCYSSDIMQQLEDCDALMWHFSQNSPKDYLFAKQLIYSVSASGKQQFPDFYTSWHFDDKVGQKYLLEAINAPIVPTWVFYSKTEALHWVKTTKFPIVFKLRGGAGSQNVQLVNSLTTANKIIRKAFGCGFPSYDSIGSIKERWRKYQLGKANITDLLKGIVRIFYAPPYARAKGNEAGYVYFQEFIPGNDSDIRIIVIGDRAFAIKRLVRQNDFRASGSGYIQYSKELFDEETLKLSFVIAKQLQSQCIAFDFVYKNKHPLLVEISYGFLASGYDACPGYWDINLVWHEGKFNPYGWMVDDLINKVILIK